MSLLELHVDNNTRDTGEMPLSAIE